MYFCAKNKYMIRLIVTDMDGTFLNENKEFPTEFFDIFEELQRRNIVFCVASGRQYPSLFQFFEKVQDKMGFVPENGAWATLCGEELYQNPISGQTLENLINICQKLEHIGIAICGKYKAYTNTQNTEMYHEMARHYPALSRISDLKTINEPIFKITIYDQLQPQNNSLLKLHSFSEEVKIVRSGDKWLDITNISANKGVAVEQIQQKLSISKEETMAFGDYFNDIEMLKIAHFSYAMKNAQPEVKKVANFITEYSNNELGVLKTIAKMLNITLNF